MEKIIMLGTGFAQALERYNTCFAMKKGGEYFLVDAGGGNGILKQLKAVNIPLEKIHTAFITHTHTDHIIGMVWIYRSIAALIEKGKYDGCLTIYCHNEAKNTLETMVELMMTSSQKALLGKKIIISEVKDGECREILGSNFTFFDIASTKIKQFGFYTQLDKGTFVCLGDEPCAAHIKPLLKDAYFVMHDAFCLGSEKDKFNPRQKHHSTVLEAAHLAQEQGIKNLLLYHTEEEHLGDRRFLYTAEATQVYSGNIFVPDDLEEILI